MPDDVQFQRGPSTSIPSELVSGTFTVQTDTRTLHLDLESERIQIQDNKKLPIDGSVAMTGNLNMNNLIIQNLGNAVSDTDAINLAQLNAAISDKASWQQCPADLDSVTTDGIYYGVSTVNYIHMPIGVSTVELLIKLQNILTGVDTQLGFFIIGTAGEGTWYHRTSTNSLWGNWVSVSGGTSFTALPQDLDSVAANGLYYSGDVAVVSGMPENASSPLIVFVTDDGNQFTGAFQMQDATLQWFGGTRTATTEAITWTAFVGEGSGGGSGDLPSGGSPDTILVGTDTPGVGAWTMTMPSAVVIDDGAID